MNRAANQRALAAPCVCRDRPAARSRQDHGLATENGGELGSVCSLGEANWCCCQSCPARTNSALNSKETALLAEFRPLDLGLNIESEALTEV